MKKYDKYKESWVEWIGKVPEDRNTNRLKDFINIFQKSNIPAWEWEDEGLYPFYTSSQELTKRIDISLFDGDAITMATWWLASVNYVWEKYSSSTDCLNFTTKQNTKFISYYLFSIKDSVINWLWFSWMWMKHLQKDELLSTSIYFPELSEQKTIADYLDEKTNNIDKRIELLQHKSEKYKTLRKNLISHVVTHGLNPDVKMKDSWIERLWEIPENWEITRIKENYYIKWRIWWQWLKANEFIDEWPYLITWTDFIDWKVNWETCYHISKQRYMEAPEIHVRPWDLLITKDWTVWKLAYIDKIPWETSLNSHLLLLRPIKKYIYNLFLYRLLSSKVFDSYFQIMRNGSIMDSLSQRTISAFIYALPPLNEQKEIVNYLDDKTSKIDKILTKIDEEIEKLKELRKVLINDAVTGKIKVI